MRRLYVEIAEPSFRALTDRALDQRRSVREQASYELERLFPADEGLPDREPPAEDHQPVEAAS